jgi:MFS transporter, SP family, sugar:H+ symporter
MGANVSLDLVSRPGPTLTRCRSSYVVTAECSSPRVKEKTSLLASSISVVTTFVTSFTLPYLLNPPYAALGGRVGYIYGSTCLACAVLAFFYIPELKGRSLEEVDQLFAMGIPLRKFNGVAVPPNAAGSEDEITKTSVVASREPGEKTSV